jgi:hypothetical protein
VYTLAAKSSRLSASAASALGDNFSLGTLKNDFAALIYKYATILIASPVFNMEYDFNLFALLEKPKQHLSLFF